MGKKDRFMSNSSNRLQIGLGLILLSLGIPRSQAAVPDIVWKNNQHAGFINGVAISPDGSLIASGSGDTTVKLWRTANGTLVRTLLGHTALVNSVAFSPDGTLLASAGGSAFGLVDNKADNLRGTGWGFV